VTKFNDADMVRPVIRELNATIARWAAEDRAPWYIRLWRRHLEVLGVAIGFLLGVAVLVLAAWLIT
jgi:hypothetical protein